MMYRNARAACWRVSFAATGRLLAVAVLLAGTQLTACAQQLAQATDSPYVDRIAYSSKSDAGLDASVANERSALMHHVWHAGKPALAYTTRTGHLIARDASGRTPPGHCGSGGCAP
ncbi:peptidase S10 [Xanthomonas translucens]|uniref:peptidase S10 n=2 Tax=Xanthomonas campestris pv. translucens TaxID=343 RepID=UPI000AE2FE38|nr:peptidase S10 [Xanthomonas translucens]MCS3373035.1 peptidase S10 [Xanthomonas translucens pv. translucens]MCT8306409.1 peptidase S10 [Xanthomonas translucens pv. translucens]MCT8312153.1 peptidase S10 [Xanthomonas translucens pv. translucens]UII59646.1 peptidase S10 [Xanthomonas translucens]